VALFDFPNPVSWFESAATGKIERETLKTLLSSAYSTYITMLFETGRRKLWGEGAALQATARATYLALGPMIDKGELALSVPKDLLDPDAMSKFQSEWNARKL
jgi:hypothetical protein